MNTKNVSREGAKPLRGLEELATMVVHTAFQLHRNLGPGLLESVYETVLSRLLEDQHLMVERQKTISISYQGIEFDEGFRADILVEKRLIVELKSVETTLPVHFKQLLTYLRLMNLPLGLMINFGAPLFRYGVKRVVNRYQAFAP